MKKTGLLVMAALLILTLIGCAQQPAVPPAVDTTEYTGHFYPRGYGPGMMGYGPGMMYYGEDEIPRPYYYGPNQMYYGE